MSRIAVNVADITRYPSFIAGVMLNPVTPNRETVDCEPGRVDGNALVLECDDKRALSIVDVFRLKDKQLKQYPLRAYREGPRGGWGKLVKEETDGS